MEGHKPTLKGDQVVIIFPSNATLSFVQKYI